MIGERVVVAAKSTRLFKERQKRKEMLVVSRALAILSSNGRSCAGTTAGWTCRSSSSTPRLRCHHQRLHRQPDPFNQPSTPRWGGGVLTSEDSRSATSTSDTTAFHRIWSDTFEHGRLLQHIWHNDESKHVASNVNVFQMRLLAIRCCRCNILHCYVEAVLRCQHRSWTESKKEKKRQPSC